MFDYFLIVFSDYCPALPEKNQLYYNADILGLTIVELPRGRTARIPASQTTAC